MLGLGLVAWGKKGGGAGPWAHTGQGKKSQYGTAGPGCQECRGRGGPFISCGVLTTGFHATGGILAGKPSEKGKGEMLTFSSTLSLLWSWATDEGNGAVCEARQKVDEDSDVGPR